MGLDRAIEEANRAMQELFQEMDSLNQKGTKESKAKAKRLDRLTGRLVGVLAALHKEASM